MQQLDDGLGNNDIGHGTNSADQTILYRRPLLDFRWRCSLLMLARRISASPTGKRYPRCRRSGAIVGCSRSHSRRWTAEIGGCLLERRGGYLPDSRGGLPQMPLCEAPPWPGDSNIVADYSA
jgi:hypothetical protein